MIRYKTQGSIIVPIPSGIEEDPVSLFTNEVVALWRGYW